VSVGVLCSERILFIVQCSCELCCLFCYGVCCLFDVCCCVRM
jgi:hypothetical protein